MSAKKRSIKQRLACAKAPGLKLDIAQDWAKNWYDDQASAIASLNAAQDKQDWQKLSRGMDQLRLITVRRFAALPNVLAAVAATEENKRSMKNDKL
jgi:hypothetical protein